MEKLFNYIILFALAFLLGYGMAKYFCNVWVIIPVGIAWFFFVALGVYDRIWDWTLGRLFRKGGEE